MTPRAAFRLVVASVILSAAGMSPLLVAPGRAASAATSGATRVRGAAASREASAGEVQQPVTLRALEWRSVGPANMGGRVSDFAVVTRRPATFYLATGTGGLFKTENRGTTWSGVFDHQPVASIGAVAVWQKRPDLVWVGTGEANSRNSSSWGDGVYRSDDGGKTWAHRGLEATRHIARVVPDPNDSNTVYVAALGRLWGENSERGVFKTTDGGRSWNHVLKVDARTGAVDLVMDPDHPNVLYAALYARKRTPWSYTSGGTTGGIFRTRDGGRTWTKLTSGLPAATGRIGLDVYRHDPRVIYAVVESDEGGRLSEIESRSRTGGVFRSVDGGDHWIRLSPFAPRPFYFSQIRVQPDDSSRVYLLGVDLWLSDDGGRNFRAGGARDLHPDCHAMWIDPANGDHVMMGTDGGLYISDDRAKNWDFVNNLPIGEFYNVAVDMRDPYYIAGGLQDNQSWYGPSRTRFEPDPFIGEARHNGILNEHWLCLGGGDGFHVAIDPTHPELIYFESQGGALHRMNIATGRDRALKPAAKEGEERFRFNWNTPFILSPHDPSVLWMGGSHVFKLTEHGDKWAVASPDLTTHDPNRMASGGSNAEAFCTVVTLSESPLKSGLLWAGTDDGKLWLTHDGGDHWTDLTSNLKGVPGGLYMSRVESSHHDPATAWVAIDGHRTDVTTPYLFVTHDYGRSWRSALGDLPRAVPVKVVREDPFNPHLLFAGTEVGFYASLDDGAHWARFDQGLPTVAVDDIVVQTRERDLVIGTHGRSLYVLDDISPLEQWTPEVTTAPVTLFTPRGAAAFQTRDYSGMWGQRMFGAKNPAPGAYLDYYVKEDTGDPVTLVVTDSTGKTVRRLTGPGTAGLHRVVWDLQANETWQRIAQPEWSGQPEFVPAGRYTVTLTYGQRPEQKRSFEVRRLETVLDPGL